MIPQCCGSDGFHARASDASPGLFLSDLEFHPVVRDERYGMRIPGRFDDRAADGQ